VKEAPCFDEIISAALKKGKNYKIIIIYNNNSEIRAPGQGRIPPPPTPFPGTPEKLRSHWSRSTKQCVFQNHENFALRFRRANDPLHHASHGNRRDRQDFRLKHRSPIVSKDNIVVLGIIPLFFMVTLSDS
jgi:hypothetical protein